MFMSVIASCDPSGEKATALAWPGTIDDVPPVVRSSWAFWSALTKASNFPDADHMTDGRTAVRRAGPSWTSRPPSSRCTDS